MPVLNIFVTSVRPDPYINVIAYCLDHRQIDEIRLVAIADHAYPEQRSEALALTVLTNIRTQLEALSCGEYIDYSSEATPSAAGMNEDERVAELYRRLRDHLERNCRVSTEVISHSSLDEALRSFAKEGNSVYDVTALRKSLLVDVISIMVSIGASGVCTFEFIRPPRHDATDLYHNLRSGDDYSYRDLTGSAPVAGAMRRITRATRRVRQSLAIIASCLLVAGGLSLWLGAGQLVTVASLIGSVTSVVALAISFTLD